jgi:hypothetical protein
MMIPHNFPCLIQRLILEAEVRFFYHDFANNCRLGIMAKAGSRPFGILALHSPDKLIT